MDGSDDSLGLGLNDFLLFKGLEENILHAIESEVQILYLLAGATLFTQGDQGDCLYGLASGQLEISVCYPDGSQLSIDILEPGAILGEIAILTGQVRTATARMLADCKLYRLSRDSFDRLANLYPILEDRLANVMSLNINRLVSTQVIRYLFGNLDPLALRELDKIFSWQHLKSGEMLYHQGEPGDSIHALEGWQRSF
jgi:CRP-like cAMP-binding protein